MHGKFDGMVVQESLEPTAVLTGNKALADGKLGESVAFSIFIGTRPVLIQLDAAATAEYDSIDDLVAQLNAQLEDTGIVCGNNDENKITFATEKMEGGTELQIYVADGQDGADGLGFANKQKSISPQPIDVQVELQAGLHDIRYEVIGLSPDLAEIGVQLSWDNAH